VVEVGARARRTCRRTLWRSGATPRLIADRIRGRVFFCLRDVREKQCLRLVGFFTHVGKRDFSLWRQAKMTHTSIVPDSNALHKTSLLEVLYQVGNHCLIEAEDAVNGTWRR
jgi:hypothetical protein